MDSLRYLTLAGVPLTAKDLALLKGSKLTRLTISDSRVSVAEVDALRKLLAPTGVFVRAHRPVPTDESKKLFAPLR